MVTSADVWEKYDAINGLNSMPNPVVFLIVFASSLFILVIVFVLQQKLKRFKKLTPEDKLLTADIIDEMPIDNFVDITDDQYKQTNDYGCYILYNTDKEKYYVGKSPLCADAVNRHIIGKGNADVFYEKKDGDEFTVQFYFVADGSAYSNADELYEDIMSVYGENSEVIGI